MLKNYGIADRKDLEDSRELTGREAADKSAGRPIGGSSWPHMSGAHGLLLCYDFYRLSNPKKYIFTLRNIRGMAEV